MDQESNTPLIRDSSPDPRSTQWGGSFESENIAARDSEPIDGIHAQTVADEVSRLLDSQNANYLVDSPRFSSGSKGADAPALRTKELVIQKVLQELEKMDMGNPSGPNLTIKQRPSTLERSNELNQLNKLNSMGNLGGLIRDLTRRSLEEVNTGGSAPIIVSYENTYNYYFGGEREAGGKDGANGKTFRKSTNFEEGSDDHGSGFDRMQSGGSENKKHKINEFFESKHKDPKNQKQFDHNTYNGGNPQNQRNFGQHQQHSGSNQPKSRDTHQQQQRFGRPEAPPDENMDPFIDPAVYSHYYHQGRANGYHPNQQPYLPYGFPKQNQIDYSTMLMGFIIILVMVLFGLLALVIKLISRKSGSSRSRSRRKKYRRRQSKETEYSGSESSHSPEHKTPRRRKHRHQELDPTFHPKFKPPSSPMISRNTPTQINYHDQQYLEWLFLKNLMMQPLARNAKTLQNSKSVEYADDEETPEEVVEYQKSIMPSEFVNNSTSIHLKNNKLGTEQVELEGYTFRKDSRVADDSSKHSVFAKFSKSNYDAQSRKSRVASRKLRRRDFAPSDLVLSAKKSFKKKRLRGNELENINTVKSQNYIELRKRRLHALQKGQGIHRSEYFPKDRSQSHSHSESDSYNLLDKLKSRKSFLEDKEEQYTGYSRGEANILSTLSGRDPVSKGVEKEVSSDILTQPVEYENHSKDFFNDIKGGRGISEQDFLIVKKNREDPCERNVRKTSEVIKSSTKLGAKGHKRTKSFRDLVKREHPNFFPLLADNVKKEKVLKFEQPSKFDQSNEIPVETQGEKTTTTHRPATKSRDIQIGNNRYFTNQEDSDQNLLFDGKELETEMMKLNITRPMFKFEQIAENSKEQTPVKGGTPKPPPVSLKTSEQKPTIPEDAPEPGFPKPGLQGDWMYTKYHSSLLEKFKKPKEPKSKVPKLKTQIDIYDENLKLKNFMYENGKFQNSFEKLKTIGRGSFGKVFLAKHLLENQQYAIKQINLTLTPKGELLTNSFQKEIRAMAVLQHKNVVRFFTSWMEEESEQKKLNSKVTSLFKVKGLKEDSVKLSFRKGSFENQPHADFNNSLLSDNQNYDWLQKRFGRINEEINSVDEKSVSGLSGAQFSRFGKTRGKLESERQLETAQARSIQAQKVESGQVHGVLKDETKDKISESENESLSNSSNSSSKSGTSHTSSSGESTRIYLDLHETDDDDLLITFDAPANKESFSKSFSKSGTNPHKKDEHSPEHQDTFPKKNAETIESQDELQIEFLENSVSDVANASHILNNTRSTFNFVKSRRGLSTAEEKSPQLCKSINLFIQMEFCSNGSLSRFLKRNTELTSGEICLIFTEILFGLSYIHEKGFIHRDLKPGNIFIAKNGSIKIGDFGLITYIKKDKINEEEERSPSTSPVKKVTPRVIRVIHEDEPKKGKESKQSLHQKDPKSKRRFTNDLLSNNPISPIPRRKRVYNPSIKELAKNSFIEQSKNFPGSHPKTLNLSTKIGTPFYTAPECMTDSNYDYKADVYSLGVILFEMFSKFTTMHERHVIFTQFKKDHRVNPQFREKHPVVADLVEYLCQGEPGNRPYASEVKMSRQYSDWMKEVEGAYGGP